MPCHHSDPSPTTSIDKRRFSDTAVVRLCLPPLSTPSNFLARAQESYEYRRDRRRLRAQLDAFNHKSSPTSTTTTATSPTSTTTTTSTDESILSAASAPPPIPPKSSARYSVDDRLGSGRRATYAAPSSLAPDGGLAVIRSRSDGGGIDRVGRGSEASGASGASRVRAGGAGGARGGGNIDDQEQPLIFREKLFGSLRRRSNSSRTTRSSIFRKRSVDVREIIEFPPPHEEYNNNHNNKHYTNEKTHPTPKLQSQPQPQPQPQVQPFEDEEKAYSPLEIITPSEEDTNTTEDSFPLSSTDSRKTDNTHPPAPRPRPPPPPAFAPVFAPAPSPANDFLASRRSVSIMLSDPIVPSQSRQEHVVRAQALAASRPWWASVQAAAAAAATVGSSGGACAWRRDDPMALTNDPWLLPPLGMR